MLVHRIDEVLARTDPFDLSQALERQVRSMSAERIRSLLIDARERMGAYYRAEFIRLLGENGGAAPNAADLNGERFTDIVRDARTDDALRQAFARLLKSNLRAIPFFGSGFTDAVLEQVPSDRAVAIGEESRPTRMRAAVFGGVALALVFAGAAGEHIVSSFRAQNAGTPAAIAPPPMPVALATQTPAPKPKSAKPQTHVTARAARIVAVSVAPTAAPETASAHASVRAVSAAPPPAPHLISQPAQASSAQKPAPLAQRAKTPPPAQGVATIAVPDPTPTPVPSALDVTDMPAAYSDATPIPNPQTAPPVTLPNAVAVKTPQPQSKPKRHGLIRSTLRMLNNTIKAIDPFKPHP